VILIDAFLYSGEYDMLKARAAHVWPHVDVVCCVEAETTFTGVARDLLFPKHLEMMDGVDLPQIRYDVPVFDPTMTAWERENAQRDHVLSMCVDDHDTVNLLVSDVDELPHIGPTTHKHGEILVYSQKFYYYNLTTRVKGRWLGTRQATLRTMRAWRPSRIRHVTGTIIEHGGYHLSYFGSALQVQHKLASFSHQEYNKAPYNTLAHIQECIDQRKDLFGRDEMQLIEDPDPELQRILDT
jgi:hypothetical protein